MRKKVVLMACYQTGENFWTNIFKTVEIEVPDDGHDWYVAGEMEVNDEK